MNIKEMLPESEYEKMSDKQLKIVEAAIETFSEKGFAATSTNEIAKKAGVAEGTIFRYYKTKKQLLLAIATPLIARTMAPVFMRQFKKEIVATSYESLDAFLFFVIRNRYQFVKKNEPIVKIVMQEVPFHEEIKEELISVFMTEMYPQLEKIIVHFQERGEISQEYSAPIVLRLLVSTAAGLIIRLLVLNREDAHINEELEIQQTVRYIMKGLAP